MSNIGDRETLLQVANTWGQFPITELEKAKMFFNQLYDATRGYVILDFLDASSWDCFESYSIDLENDMLQINWRDFVAQDKQYPRSEARKMTAMAFPASLYGMVMRFNRIERIGPPNIACFALRGYALTDKEVRKALSPGSEDFLIRKDRAFSREALRKVDGHVEIIDCINSAVFTVLIVPKKLHIPAHTSKAFLYSHNLMEIDEALNRCEAILKEMDVSDTVTADFICPEFAELSCP